MVTTRDRASATSIPRQSVAAGFDGLSQVGALFANSSDEGPHFCTASVVHSRGGDIIATAAHCLAGTGAGLLFVPGYHDGIAPYGTWPVTAAYVDPRWLGDRDPMADYAFLRVAPQTRNGRSVEIEQVVGSDRLAIDQSLSTPVTVVAYPGRVGGRALMCATTTYGHLGYAGFDCRGFVGGTSGAPWLMDSRPGHASRPALRGDRRSAPRRVLAGHVVHGPLRREHGQAAGPRRAGRPRRHRPGGRQRRLLRNGGSWAARSRSRKDTPSSWDPPDEPPCGP